MRSALRRFAVPRPGPARRRLDERATDRARATAPGIVRCDDCQALGLFPLRAGVVLVTIETQQRRELRIGPPWQQLRGAIRAGPRRAVTRQWRARRHAGSTGTRARRTSTPSRQWMDVNATRKAVPSSSAASSAASKTTSLFECVVTSGVVAYASRTDHVGLGRMEITARRVDAQRPARRAVLLPRRQPHRAAQKLADLSAPLTSAGLALPSNSASYGTSSASASARQLDGGCVAVPPEWIRLGRPVEITERPRKAVEMMLRLVVVAEGRTPSYFDSRVIRRSSSAIASLSCCFRAWCVASSNWRCISVCARRHDSQLMRARSGSAALGRCCAPSSFPLLVRPCARRGGIPRRQALLLRHPWLPIIRVSISDCGKCPRRRTSSAPLFVP